MRRTEFKEEDFGFRTTNLFRRDFIAKEHRIILKPVGLPTISAKEHRIILKTKTTQTQHLKNI